MASKYQESQREKQVELLYESNLFNGDSGNGRFMGKVRPFILHNGLSNFYPPIKEDVQTYFTNNSISWWGGSRPTGHLLSSQMACLNHLFHIRKDKEVVLKLLNGVKDLFVDVLPIPNDKGEDGYIAFEAVSGDDYLNEQQSTRGSNCTSIDAFIYAKDADSKLWLIPIEWKYTEFYNNQDKSTEDHPGDENKGKGGKGKVRLDRYRNLINDSAQLKSLSDYKGSVYYQEPFYQLMRQTLWAEQVIAHRNSDKEKLKADNYLHIHVIPSDNKDLLDKKYHVSQMGMEDTWRSCLTDSSKYVIIDPKKLMEPLVGDYSELSDYLSKRYWG